MKRLLTLTALAVVALCESATAAFASGAFGLFYDPLYCDKRCGAFAIQKNAFTQVPNCCPGPCWAPGCNPTGPAALVPYGFNGPQSFGLGGFGHGNGYGGGCLDCGGSHVRKLFTKHWTRCGGGDCGVGYDGYEGGPIFDGGPIGYGAPCLNGSCPGTYSAAPPGPIAPVASDKPAVPYWTANLNAQQWPANYAQPVSYQGYQGYGYNYGYGYYPAAVPMYNPMLWQGWGYPSGQ
jgi:hypothetical protein